VAIVRWWVALTSAERVDVSTRWPMYALFAFEPLAALLMLEGQPGPGRLWRLGCVLLVVSVHAACCAWLLHAGIGYRLGGRPMPYRPMRLAAALTVIAVAISVALLRGSSGGDVSAGHSTRVDLAMMGVVVSALTVALAPLLRAYQLLALVLVCGLGVGVSQASGSLRAGLPWTFNYLGLVGPAALLYRFQVWFLGVVWEMHRGREAQARLAVAEERLRFARDLHDVLGRNLAVIALNSELASKLLPAGLVAQAATEQLRTVRQTAEDSMRELRDVVSGYRTTNLETELAGARSLLHASGVDARIIGDSVALPPATQTALGWVVREATTNIIRHSDATEARIEVDLDPLAEVPTAMLRIGNDHARPAGSGTGSGSGLLGLRERLSGLGGDLCWQAEPGERFLVQARMPLSEPSPARVRSEP
jgi:two-component system, NarL family, sensor histidine kinase DesK